MDVIAFGRGIRALRLRRHWTQDQLARRASVSRSVVARVEQGRGDRVTVATLDRIAAAVAVGRSLVIRESRTARRRIEEHAATFGTMFPDRIGRIRSWLKEPDPRSPLRGLWFLPNGPQEVARRSGSRPTRSPKHG